MKKLITLISGVVMAMTLTVITCAAGIVYGDVTADSSIDASDALAALKHAAKLEIIEDELSVKLADANNDKVIDALDALDVLKMAAKLIDLVICE